MSDDLVTEESVLEALRALGGWVRPIDIGATSERGHYTILSRLVCKGRVERRGQAGGGAKIRNEYRARNV